MSTRSCTVWEGEVGKVVSRFCLPDFHTVSIQEGAVGGKYAICGDGMPKIVGNMLKASPGSYEPCSEERSLLGLGQEVGAGHYTARNRFAWIIRCMQHRRCRCTVRVGGGLGETKA